MKFWEGGKKNIHKSKKQAAQGCEVLIYTIAPTH